MNLKALALILKGLRVSGSWVPMHADKNRKGLSMNRTDFECGLHRKRRRTAALQDADASVSRSNFHQVLERAAHAALWNSRGGSWSQLTASESRKPPWTGTRTALSPRTRLSALVCPAGADTIGMRVPDGVDDGNRSQTASAGPRGTKRKSRRQTLDCRNTNRQRGREQRASRRAQAKPNSHQTGLCRA